MKKLRIIIIAVILIQLWGGCFEVNQRRGISNVSIGRIDVLDECTNRYYVSFSDDLQNSNNANFSYWVGLKRVNESGTLVAYSPATSLMPPFADRELTVDLDHNAHVVPGEDLIAVAARSEHPGDLSSAYGTGIDQGGQTTAPTFPSSCGDFAILVTAGGAPINNGDCVFITDMPAMPNLTAKIVSGGVNGTVNWQLIISYTRNGRQDYDTITASLSAPESWDITAAMGTKIRGGQAMLICHALDSNW